MLKKISDIRALLDNQDKKKRLVLAVAQDENALEAAINARNEGVIEPILTGDKEQIEEIANRLSLDLTGVEIHDEKDPVAAANIAVKLANSGEADIVMKGYISTGKLLKAVLNKEFGLRTGKLISHLAVFEIEAYHKLIGLTDAAMNIAPDLEQKASIIQNAVEFMQMLGIEEPKVAALTAVEVVNPNMSATIDGAILSKMAQRGQLGKCIVDGPLAFDNAISKESAKHKKIVSDVAGDTDILFAPELVAANALYKTFVYFSKAKAAAVILGASVPIVLTSRADSDETKLNSITLAAAVNF